MTDVVKGFRQVIQDLLVPELKAVQAELKHDSEQFALLLQEITTLRQEFESMQGQIHEVILSQKEILAKLDLDKRLTKEECWWNYS